MNERKRIQIVVDTFDYFCLRAYLMAEQSTFTAWLEEAIKAEIARKETK